MICKYRWFLIILHFVDLLSIHINVAMSKGCRTRVFCIKQIYPGKLTKRDGRLKFLTSGFPPSNRFSRFFYRDPNFFSFFLLFFCIFVFFCLCRPSEANLQFHANPAGSPTWNDMSLQVGEMPDSNPGLQVLQSGALPISHHIPGIPKLYMNFSNFHEDI